MVAGTLVVCGQWETCCFQKSREGRGAFAGVGRGRLDFGRMWSVGDVLCPEVAGGAGRCSRGWLGRLDFGRMWSVGDVLCVRSRGEGGG